MPEKSYSDLSREILEPLAQGKCTCLPILSFTLPEAGELATGKPYFSGNWLRVSNDFNVNCQSLHVLEYEIILIVSFTNIAYIWMGTNNPDGTDGLYIQAAHEFLMNH
jgi:hypothetical protein